MRLDFRIIHRNDKRRRRKLLTNACVLLLHLRIIKDVIIK